MGFGYMKSGESHKWGSLLEYGTGFKKWGLHMKPLEMKDWLLLNNMIYKIHTMDNEMLMRKEFLEQMKMLISFDSAAFFLADREQEQKLTRPVVYNCREGFVENYGLTEFNRGILCYGKSMVYRETDIISDEKKKNAVYYNKIYRPNNWFYSLQMMIAKDDRFLGIVDFYRNVGRDDFRHEDIFILDVIKDHMSYRIARDFDHDEKKEEKLTIRETVEKYQLTKREETILGFLMDGADNMQICDELVISLNTLKKHIMNIYRKLGIRNRVQLFKMVREYAD